MDRGVGRAADRRVDDDGVEERVAGHDVGRLDVLQGQLDDPQAGFVGILLPVAVRGGDGGRAGQRHAQRLGQRVHGRGRAHGVAVAGRGGRAGHQLDEAGAVDLAGRQHLAGLPDDGARAGALALVPAVQHRAHRQGDGRDVDAWRRPSDRPGWSCRSRWSAPRRRSDSRTGSRPAPDRTGCRSRPAVRRLPVSWIGWTGNSRAMPPAVRMPSRIRSARTRWWRLQGEGRCRSGRCR